MCEEKMPIKVIYKKTLFQELVKRGHNFLYSTKNRKNPHYQCFMFEATAELDKDLAKLSHKEYDKTMYSDKK